MPVPLLPVVPLHILGSMEIALFVMLGIVLTATWLVLLRAILSMQVRLNASQKPSGGPATAALQPYDDTELRSLISTLSQAVLPLVQLPTGIPTSTDPASSCRARQKRDST